MKDNERPEKITSDREKPNPPPQAFPLPPSNMRVPRAPCIPTPKPRWPLHAIGGPDVLLTSVVERKRGLLGCTAHRRAARNFGAVPPPSGTWELPGLFQDGCPEGFLLALPLGQFLRRCSRVWMLYWHHQHIRRAHSAEAGAYGYVVKLPRC